MHMFHAFAQADNNAKIFMKKWDIKDGFWWLDCMAGRNGTSSMSSPNLRASR